MDPENIHNEDYYTGSEILMSIKQECHYFIKHIQPHGFKFLDIYEYCSNNTQLGLKSGGIHHCTGCYLKKTLRIRNTQTNYVVYHPLKLFRPHLPSKDSR